MKTTVLGWCIATAFALLALTDVAQAQTFVKKTHRIDWYDQLGRPWNDLSSKMAIQIDPFDVKDMNLPAEEISSNDTPPLTYKFGDWHFFNLRRDANGRTYAEAEVLVRADSPETIPYRAQLRKGDRGIKFAPGANTNKIDIGNDSPPSNTQRVNEPNAIFLKDWLTIAGILLLGLILVYILIFRVLFRGLLFKRRWGVPNAEHFTWSMSLLVMLALASGLTLFYLGPRLETYIIISVMGSFWLLHAIVWLISGKEA